MNAAVDVFREYDIRGLVDQELTAHFAYHLGCAIGTYMRQGGGKSIVVGQDCRLSGTWLSQDLIQGLLSTGIDVTHIDTGPTPLGYWAIEYLQTDGGVQITGSHNPPAYNGFKLTLLGKSLHGQDIQLLRKLMETEAYATGSGRLVNRAVLPDYIDALAKNLKPCARPLKVVIDAGNGTGGITALPLYQKLGYQVIPLFCEMDGNFPNHHPDPSVEDNLADLKAAVLREHADIGIAFDGDADRLGVVNHLGEVIWGDQLMVLFARDVLKDVPGATIIGEVKCSKVLYDDIAKHGGRPIMWRTGHSLIKSKMKEEHAALAGEMSGHIFFKHRYHGFDDAVYAGGRLLEILSHTSQTLQQLLQDLPRTESTPEIRFDCPEHIKFKLVQRITAYFQEGASQGGYKVIAIDGARVEWADGWGLVRPSNTQPILVLRFEAYTVQRLNEIRTLFETTIKRIKAELTH